MIATQTSLPLNFTVLAITDSAFRTKVAALNQELEGLNEAKPPLPVQQTAAIETLADRWGEMQPAQRRRLLATIFESITMRDGTIVSAKPQPAWLDYFTEVTTLPENRPLRGWGESNSRRPP
jgi:aminoglycoside/choline kinase family phosphotransferase